LGDDNGTIGLEKVGGNKWKLKNFPSYAGNDCVKPITATVYNNNGTQNLSLILIKKFRKPAVITVRELELTV